MANKGFSAAQRWAIYTVHGERCYLGTEPLHLVEMEIDHIIPESLLSHPKKLAAALKEFCLPPDFDLNSYENLLPACRRCNNLKRETVFKPTLLVQLNLDKAKDKAPEVARVVKQVIERKKLSKALNFVHQAVDSGRFEPFVADEIGELSKKVSALPKASGVGRRPAAKAAAGKSQRPDGKSSSSIAGKFTAGPKREFTSVIKLMKAFREINNYKVESGIIIKMNLLKPFAE